MRLGEGLTTPKFKIVDRIINIQMTCLVMILWRTEVFQLLRVAASILNKKLHTADKGWPSSFEIGRGTNNS